MSTSRRSSKSRRSSTTTRSARPPTWRATSLISGVAPGLPLAVSKNSVAPEVSIVFAEPETVSSSSSSASKLAPTLSNRSKLTYSTSVDGVRPVLERKKSSRTRVQNVFRSEDLGEGTSGIAFPSVSSPALLESSPPSLSSSPSRASWFGSVKGKEKAVETPKSAFQSLDPHVPLDGVIENNEALSNAIDALGSTEPYSADTLRASDPLETPKLTIKESSRTVRASNDTRPQKHSWFNPFAPYPPQTSHISNSTPISASPTSPSPLSRASSSYGGSIDEGGVPGLVRTPIQSDDEDSQEVQTMRRVTGPVLANADLDTTTNEDSLAQTLQPRRRLNSLNSLNPSTSRFSISLPLLGRPKMRLEDAVKRGNEADTAERTSIVDLTEAMSTTDASSITNPTPSLASDSTTTPIAAGQPDTASPDMSVPPVTASDDTTSLPVPLESGTGNATQNETPSVHSREETNSSWWSYVGWNTSQPSVARTDVPPTLLTVPEITTENIEDGSNTAQLPLTPPERSMSAPPIMKPSDVIAVEAEAEPIPPTKSSDMPISPSSQTPTQNDGTHVKPPSIFSLDTARAAGSWLFPWTWYGYETTGTISAAKDALSSTSGSIVAQDAEVLNSETGDEGDENQKKEMTESEKIKEAALARDREPDTTATPTATASSSEPPAMPDNSSTVDTVPVAPVSSSADPINPIADSASSLRSGWASFFSLSRGRGLLTKNLHDAIEEGGEGDGVKRDENGVEVMDLDEEDVGGDSAINARVEVQAEVIAPVSEKAISVTKIPTSTALSLMRALAGHDVKMIESKDEKGHDAKVATTVTDDNLHHPPSPQLASKRPKELSDTHRPISASVPASPTNAKASRHGRNDSVNTTKTSASSTGNKPAPPLTISDDIKASVAAAKKAKRSGEKLSSGAAGPSSLPKDGISAPPGRDEIKKEVKDKSKPVSKSGTSTPGSPPPPNIVLPSWEDTFHTLPRSMVPEYYLPAPIDTPGGFGSTIGKTMRYMSGVLLGGDSGYTSGGESSRLGAGAGATKRRTRRGSSRRRSISGDSVTISGGVGVGGESELIAREREKLRELINWGQNLPRALDVISTAIENRTKPKPLPEKKGKAKAVHGQEGDKQKYPVDVTRGCKKVVIIGVHGWFPGAIMRSMLGEPTGTSSKFANMMEQALEEFQSKHGVKFDKITKIPLEGEGTINGRVEKLYKNLLSNKSWVDDLHNADVIFVATHSQGSVVSTHLLDRLIRDGHIRTTKNSTSEAILDLGINMVLPPPQRVCCLALCGIHLGPLRYLSSSSLLQPYIQYFETNAARELFEFQNTESEVSKAYVQALKNVVHHETKMVYVASLNDQVVPIYSGLFTSASHPLILRALYIDGDAYNSSDFLTNLLVLLLRVLNCGLSDSGLLAHLSEVTAGSLNGIGHSTAYEELSTFSLAVNYLFLTNNGLEDHPELTIEPFNASNEMNDYEIPWALRDLVADERVTHYFSQEITQLRDAFREWHPKTTILRDIKRKLQPIQRLPTTFTPGTANSGSKL